MIYFHNLPNEPMDFAPYSSRHSADQTCCYKTVGNEQLNVGLFYPPQMDRSKTYPLFVFVHGGGWASRKIFADQQGWQGDYLGFLARYYANKGFVCASIDYRLTINMGQTQGYQLPDLLADCVDAISFLQQNTTQFCINWSKTALLGESAGGYLAAAMATFLPTAQLWSKVVLVNAITDMTDKYWGTYLPQQAGWGQDKIVAFSPAHQIGANTAPTLLLHGTADSVVNSNHSQVFCQNMALANRWAELHWLREVNHAFLLAEFMQETGNGTLAATAAVQIIDDFICNI